MKRTPILTIDDLAWMADALHLSPLALWDALHCPAHDLDRG